MPIIAKHCPEYHITVVDLDNAKIAAWNSDALPIHEPGLLQVVLQQRGKNLFFSSDVEAVRRSTTHINETRHVGDTLRHNNTTPQRQNSTADLTTRHQGIREAQMLFVCIPTPTKTYGRGKDYA
jgi:UDP-glucose 6-dehydrogenase